MEACIRLPKTMQKVRQQENAFTQHSRKECQPGALTSSLQAFGLQMNRYGPVKIQKAHTQGLFLKNISNWIFPSGDYRGNPQKERGTTPYILKKSKIVSHKIKTRIMRWSSNSTARHMPKKNKKEDTHVRSSIIYNSQRQEWHQCPPTDNEWHSPTVECYSPSNRKEHWLYTIMWWP